MKKIITLTLALVLILQSMLVLTACQSGDSDTPEGMQLVAGGEALGYYFWGPEEWVVANQGNIKATYVSSIDYSSCTFTQTNVNYLTEAKDGATYRDVVKAAFTASSNGYLEAPFKDYKEDAIDQKCSFGNANEAYKYIFSYTFEDKPYVCMQIFTTYGGESYIFTFNSSAKEYSEKDGSYYQFYLKNKVQPIIDSFKFVEKSGTEESPQYEKDGRGNILATDKIKCGFKLWVPESYTVDYSSAMVSVTKAGGGNITVSRLINTNISIKDNYLERKELLSELADKVTDPETGELVAAFTEIKGIIKNDDGTENMHIVDIPNVRSAAELEYTYVLDGTTYHVYQVFLVNGYFSVNAHVFTFTAREDVYSFEISEVMEILKNMEF